MNIDVLLSLAYPLASLLLALLAIRQFSLYREIKGIKLWYIFGLFIGVLILPVFFLANLKAPKKTNL